MAIEDRYRLCAFVSEDKDVDERHDQGFSTFTDIYVRRANEQRYAVAEDLNSKFVVWDLYDALKSGDGMTFTPPQPIRVCEERDQAIMATMFTAERPE